MRDSPNYLGGKVWLMLKIDAIGTDNCPTAATLGQCLRIEVLRGRQIPKGNRGMDLQGTKLTLLARIPDLSIAQEKPSKSLPLSKGRILNQAISFKLLAVAVVLLVVVALLPKVLKRGGSADTSVATESAPAWGGSAAATSSGAVAEVPAGLPAQASSSPIAGVASRSDVASAIPTSTSVDEPLMSTWPNPNYPISSSEAGGGESQSGANQPMALRPSEYIRDSHDSTRSSIH